ncbi:MAG: hypothetical protein IPM29_28015 [Planctomycetes bacterium]|nr:hypothetical protein [Planctomycetota bacterium]
MTRESIASLFISIWLCGAAVVRAQSGDPFVGVFVGDSGQSLALRADGAGYAGTYRPRPDTEYALRGTRNGDSVVCAYPAALGEVRFTLSPVEGGLIARFVLGEVRLRRLPPPDALRDPGPPAAARAHPVLSELGAVRTDPARRWTIVCYIAADNDLEAAGLLDLQEMLRGLPATGVEIVALVDRAKGYFTNPDARQEWTDARVFWIHRAAPTGDVVGELIARPGEVDMGDETVLASFVAGALRAFPAERHMLVLWDHGGGWVGQCLDIDAPGRDGRTELSLVGVRRGVEAALLAAGVDRFDVIGFDECLMAQLETACELAGVADFLLASEAVEPGYGWPWDTLLALFEGQSDVRTIVAGVVGRYAESYADIDANTTLAALDLRALEPFLQSFDALVAACDDLLAEQWPRVARSLYLGEAYAGRGDVTRGAHAVASVDLFDVLMRTRLSVKPFPAEPRFEAFAQAHAALVVQSLAGPGRRFSHGVSIYAPPTAAQWNPAYLDTRLGARGTWARFLQRLHGLAAADETPLRFTESRITTEFGQPETVVTPLDGDALQATLSGNNVIWTRLLDCTVVPNGGGDCLVASEDFVFDAKWLTRLGDASADPVDRMMPVYQDGESVLRHELHGVGLMVTDGRLTGRATLIRGEPDPLAPIVVAARYEHPDTGGFSIAEVQFDPITWQAARLVAFVEQPNGQLVPRVIPREQGGDLILLHRVLKADDSMQWQRGTFVQWGPELRLEPDAVTVVGDRVALLTATTMAGRMASRRVPYRMGPSPFREQWRASWQAHRPGWFAGRWEQDYMGPDRRWLPLGVALDASADGADHYGVAARFPGAAEPARHEWTVYPGAGAIRIVARGSQGQPDSVYWGPVRLVSDDEFVAKMVDFGGVLWRFHRAK